MTRASLKGVAARVNRLVAETARESACKLNHVRYKTFFGDSAPDPEVPEMETHCVCGQVLTIYHLVYPE